MHPHTPSQKAGCASSSSYLGLAIRFSLVTESWFESWENTCYAFTDRKSRVLENFTTLSVYVEFIHIILPNSKDSGNKKDVCTVRLQITGFVHCCQRCWGPGTMKVMFFFLFIPFVWFWRFRGLNRRHCITVASACFSFWRQGLAVPSAGLQHVILLLSSQILGFMGVHPSNC